MKPQWKPSELRAAFAERGPWQTVFPVGREMYGGGEGPAFDSGADKRVDWFRREFGELGTVAELTCYEGAHSWKLAAGCQSLLVFEGRTKNISRAEWIVRDVYGFENVRFHHCDIETIELQSFGPFDAAFCSGVLYHLEDPRRLIQQIGSATSAAFIWTHYARPEHCDEEFGKYRVQRVQEGVGRMAALRPITARRLQLADLLYEFKKAGFSRQTILNQDHETAEPSITIALRKEGEP